MLSRAVRISRGALMPSTAQCSLTPSEGNHEWFTTGRLITVAMTRAAVATLATRLSVLALSSDEGLVTRPDSMRAVPVAAGITSAPTVSYTHLRAHETVLD